MIKDSLISDNDNILNDFGLNDFISQNSGKPLILNSGESLFPEDPNAICNFKLSNFSNLINIKDVEVLKIKDISKNKN